MRPRSITGPLIVILIGAIFLVNNLRPDFSPFALIVTYWPFLLIGAGVIGLIEVLFYASHGAANPPRPLGGGWIFWIVVWAVIAGVLSSQPYNIRFPSFNVNGVTLLGSDYDYDVPPVGAPQVASQGVTRVVLDNLHGNLTVHGVDSGDIKVTGRKSIRAYSRDAAGRANQQVRVTLEHEGDAMVIGASEPERSGAIQVSTDLDIAVPRNVTVESRGRSGELSVDDIDGGVDLSSGRGDIHLTHIGKDVKIESARGADVTADDVKGSFSLDGRGSDVQLSNIAGEVVVNGEFSGNLEFRALAKPLHFESSRTEFRVEAVPGVITLSLGDLRLTGVSGPVRFQTGTRDIEATDVTNAIDLTVNRGDVQVTENKAPLPRIDVHSHNGDITLAVPAGSGFDLKASTARGEAENDFGSPLAVQQSGHGASIEGSTGAGPPITLATDRGTVSVKKL